MKVRTRIYLGFAASVVTSNTIASFGIQQISGIGGTSGHEVIAKEPDLISGSDGDPQPGAMPSTSNAIWDSMRRVARWPSARLHAAPLGAVLSGGPGGKNGSAAELRNARSFALNGIPRRCSRALGERSPACRSNNEMKMLHNLRVRTKLFVA
jgi:hypothetical protein